ncbi:protein scylla-like [Sabethes cyaneus]|uniref:protein scylla-like n=1 Tax=Sabethes cyaneus TaxID=53552 RepID=UPI00221E2D31|nr:protein scylla-like [Sabethes cyaneus]
MSANFAAIDDLVEEFLKMELISVPPYPGQLGYLGSNKVNDFRTPLMPIPASSNKASNQRHQAQHQQQPSSQQVGQRNHHHHHHHHHHYQPSQENQQEPATIALTASPHEDALQALAARLESELRTAKRRHLVCTEVLLPADLLPRIASQMFELSEKEPCGIRGCTVYIEFEDEPDNSRRIATMKTDPTTVSTFELYLTLRQDRSGWTSILPQFLKNLARGSTIMISPEFALTKNKLYHTYSD